MHFALDLPKNWNASLSSKGQKFLPLLLLFCANVRISAPEILIAMDAGWTILISSSNSCAGKLLARISRDYQCSARQLFGPSVYPYRLMWSGLIQFSPETLLPIYDVYTCSVGGIIAPTTHQNVTPNTHTYSYNSFINLASLFCLEWTIALLANASQC